MDEEIHSLLKQLEGDEDLVAAAREYMSEFRAFALARPVQAHVELLRALLKARLGELIASARREGRI